MNPTILVADQDGEYELSASDLLKYTTKANNIAAALMIRLCRCAFAKLAPNQAIYRRELYWKIGFPGAGILDCIEMISHAIREGRCLQMPIIHDENAPAALLGQFYFEISYRGKSVKIYPSAEVFDDEFRTQVSQWQEQNDSPERAKFLQFKQAKVTQIMNLSEDELFHLELLPAN